MCEQKSARVRAAARGAFCRQRDRQRNTGEIRELPSGIRERRERGVRGVHLVPQRARDVQSGAVAAGVGHRESAARENHGIGHQGLCASYLYAPAIVKRDDVGDARFKTNARPARFGECEKSVAHIARFVRGGEYFLEFWLVGERNSHDVFEECALLGEWPRTQNAIHRVGRRVGDKARLVEIDGQHVAAPAAADENLAATILGTFEQRSLGARRRRKDCRHRARGTGANHNHATSLSGVRHSGI
jgi:hypothetical protein